MSTEKQKETTMRCFVESNIENQEHTVVVCSKAMLRPNESDCFMHQKERLPC